MKSLLIVILLAVLVGGCGLGYYDDSSPGYYNALKQRMEIEQMKTEIEFLQEQQLQNEMNAQHRSPGQEVLDEMHNRLRNQ